MKLFKLGISLVLSVSLLATFAFAEEMEPPDSNQTEQTETETTEVVEVSESTSIVQDEQPEPDADGASQAAEEQTAQTEVELAIPETTTQEFIPYETYPTDYEYQILVKLTSIDYQLKIIAGGVILTAIIFYIWLTVLSVIKKFSYF